MEDFEFTPSVHKTDKECPQCGAFLLKKKDKRTLICPDWQSHSDVDGESFNEHLWANKNE